VKTLFWSHLKKIHNSITRVVHDTTKSVKKFINQRLADAATHKSEKNKQTEECYM